MWVVQTHTEFDGWLCTWGVTGADNIRRPDMYETEAEALAEMAEALRDDRERHHVEKVPGRRGSSARVEARRRAEAPPRRA